jgi:hypothetical protein
MMPFVLPAGRDGNLKASLFVAQLPVDKAWRVTVEPYRPRRSDDQNRYLWGVVYPAIQQALEGWDKDDIHEYCLGECFGWETIEGLGRKRLRPLRRSSRMNKQEFTDYIAWIQRRMAEHGIYIPEPGELDHG